MNRVDEEINRLHEEACVAGKSYYIDPLTSYRVMTRKVHLQRGYCCGSKCRHCPYNHENVGKVDRKRIS